MPSSQPLAAAERPVILSRFSLELPMSRRASLILLLIFLPLWLAASYGLRFALMEDDRWVGLCVEEAARWECQLRAGIGLLMR